MSEIKPTNQIEKPEQNNNTRSFLEPNASNISRKRKASEMDKPLSTNSNGDNYKASEEEMRGRKIVRVIRNEEGVAKPAETIRGKFVFNQETKTNELDSAYKFKPVVPEVEEVKLSAKKSEPQEEKKEEVGSTSSKKINFGPNPFTKKEESNTTNSITTLSIPVINNIQPSTSPNLSVLPTIIENPFTKKEPAQSNILTNPFLKPNPNISTNPFVNSGVLGNVSSNPFIKPETVANPFTKHATSNPFATNVTSNFNFNLNKAASNPNWNSDEEEEGNGVEDNNPEEEVAIKGEPNTVRVGVIRANPNTHKLVRLPIDDLSDYDFEAKKYHSKGKGELSIEVKKAPNDNLIALLVYRNSAMVPIFTAQIVKGISSCEGVVKNYKHFGMVQKLSSRNETSGKNENKSIKLTFSTENDSKNFGAIFRQAMKILVDNDHTLLL